MTSAKDQHLTNVAEIRKEIQDILDGMENVLDWRPDADSWTAREVITHVLYTPPGGVPQILRGIMDGEVEEYDLWADQKYMTSEAESWTLDEVRRQFNSYFDALESGLAPLTDEVLETSTALVHQRNRLWDEPRTAQWLVERLFAGHWREHLVQLRELKAEASG
ncbi:MAG: DinB family protein [Chloroflexi bacterium]|nr:DinB family protein [Chloroflexota bacterium]